MTWEPGRLKREAAAWQKTHGVDIRKLPKRALRLLSKDRMTPAELAFVAGEIAELKRKTKPAKY